MNSAWSQWELAVADAPSMPSFAPHLQRVVQDAPRQITWKFLQPGKANDDRRNW